MDPHVRDELFPTNLWALVFISIYAGLKARIRAGGIRQLLFLLRPAKVLSSTERRTLEE